MPGPSPGPSYPQVFHSPPSYPQVAHRLGISCAYPVDKLELLCISYPQVVHRLSTGATRVIHRFIHMAPEAPESPPKGH